MRKIDPINYQYFANKSEKKLYKSVNLSIFVPIKAKFNEHLRSIQYRLFQRR